MRTCTVPRREIFSKALHARFREQTSTKSQQYIYNFSPIAEGGLCPVSLEVTQNYPQLSVHSCLLVLIMSSLMRFSLASLHYKGQEHKHEEAVGGSWKWIWATELTSTGAVLRTYCFYILLLFSRCCLKQLSCLSLDTYYSHLPPLGI